MAWVSAILDFLNSVARGCLNIKEYFMKKLHAMVLPGVALLPVPGRVDESQPG